MRDQLKKALDLKGLDIATTFKKFDTNKDGRFDKVEFEAIFTVLEIDFKVAQLRTLVAFSDKDRDGKIDIREFTKLLEADMTPVEEKEAK